MSNRFSKAIARVALAAAMLLGASSVPAASVESTVGQTIREVRSRVVKLYGAGGIRGLEAYQSGFLVSDQGHIVTVWSYVLDTDWITATLDDGRRFEAKLVGADPRLELAVLKIDAADLPWFNLNEAVEVEAGTRVLALSNLFGVASGNEPVSVQHGVVAARTALVARSGTFETPYHGPVYVLDVATNNPGAAGGVLVTRRGNLLGMLGKELQNAQNRTWLNYAVPISELRGSVEAILAGKFVARDDEPAQKPERALSTALLGIVLVPDVVSRTPPYVDQVRAGSPAAAAGIRPDDLVLLVGDRPVASCRALRGALSHIDFEDPIELTILRREELLVFPLGIRQQGDRLP